MTDKEPSVGRQIARGAAWTTGMRLTIRGLGIISMLILARLLEPGDFGLVALATMVVGAVEILSSANVEGALIHNQSATQQHYNSAWTINIGCGAMGATALVLVAAPAAQFFSEPRLTPIVYCLAVATLLNGFRNIGIVDFTRSLWFGQDYKFNVAAKLSSFFVTIACALIWRNYWALVAGILVAAAAKLVLSYAMHPFRPRIDTTKAREIFRYSKWLLLNEWLFFVGTNIDRLLIGRFLNTTSLGVFALAREISSLTSTEIIQPVIRAAFPGYSKISQDPDRLRRLFMGTLGLVFLFGSPLGFGIAALAPLFTQVLLGPKWTAVGEILPYLVIGGTLSLSWANTSSLFMSVGRPEIAALTDTIKTVLQIALMALGFYLGGLIGLAQATIIAHLLAFPLIYLYVRRCIGLTLSEYFGAIWRSLAASIAMYVTLLLMQGAIAFDALLPLRLVFFVFLGAVVYCGSQLLLWRLSGMPDGAERQVLDMLSARFWSRAGAR